MRKTKPSDAVLPAPGEGKRGTEGHLGYLLRQAGVAVRTKIERSLSETGTTQPQFVILTMIEAYPGLSGADLARLSLLTPQTVSVIVANLKRDGLVADGPHPIHGRIRCLNLTQSGRERLEACKARVRVVEAELSSGLTTKEEAVVRNWLVQVATKERSGRDASPLQ
jgi:DNA-binding MarR family transcriptional regulator